VGAHKAIQLYATYVEEAGELLLEDLASDLLLVVCIKRRGSKDLVNDVVFESF
jgi:hypothetical protein